MQDLKALPERFFSDGMNDDVKPEFLKEGQSAMAKNCLLTNEDIDKGPGSVAAFDLLFNTPSLGGISTTAEIYGAFDNALGTSCDIYRWTGSGSPTIVAGSSLTAGQPVNFVDCGVGVYVLNGVNPTGKLIGATYSNPALVPIGKFGAWVNNRLYVGGNNIYKNRAFYSDVNDSDTFGVNSNIDIFPDDRSYLTGFSSFNGTLAITKLDNVLTFDGFTEDDFTIKRVKDQLATTGCTSYRSIVNTGDDLLFMSFSGFIPHIRSLKRTQFQAFNDGGIISKDIEGTMKTINKSRLDQVSGGFDGKLAWWSIPIGSSTTNNLTICKDMTKEGSKGWTMHENLNANVFFKSAVTGTDRFYFGSADATSKILYLDENIGSRDGEAIDLDFQSRYYRPDLARKSKFKYVYSKSGLDVASTINVYASADGYTSELQDQWSALTGSGGFPFTFPFSFGATANKRHRTNLKTPQANTLQIQFTESSTNKLNIKEYDLFYYTRGLRDV